MLLSAGPSRRVLLTGASGLLGGELAGRLVDAGHAVTGLVGRTAQVVRNDNRPVPAAPWAATPAGPGTLRLLRSDLSRPGLGLDDAARRALAGSHDLVLHCAALTRFDAAPAEYDAVNVDGTGRVLALAAAGGMGVLHVSTAYVCGLREGLILETDADAGPGAARDFANGYERSKAAAERLVRASGLPAAILRPSIVVGDHAEGRIRRFDTFYAVLKLLAENRLPVMPARTGAALDLVPIDHVADVALAAVERFEAAAGRAFHLVAARPTPVEAFPAALAAHPGLAVPRLVDPAGFDPERLPHAERRFFRRGASLYAGYFSRAPRFDDRETRALLGRPPPPVDRDWWDRLIRHAIAAGFVRPAVPASGVRRGVPPAPEVPPDAASRRPAPP